MTEPTPIAQPKGKAKANFVRVLAHDPRYAKLTPAERVQNDRLPLFRGTVSAPEAPEELYEFALWDHTDDKGNGFLAGSVRPLSTRAGIEDHLAATPVPATVPEMGPEGDGREGEYTLSPHAIIARVNARKILKSDPRFAGLTDADREKNNRAPLYWFKWQRDAGTPELRGSLWDKAGRYGPFLDGNTQYPLTREQLEERQGQPQRELTLDAPSKEIQAPAKRRSGGRGR